MYVGIGSLENMALCNDINMPIFLCEYSHAMGNGPGDVWDYNDILLVDEDKTYELIEKMFITIRKIFKSLYAGSFSKSLYKIYEYEK